MKIVLTGGGSGGHITPILAVAAELKRRQPLAKLIYIGQTGDKLGDVPARDPNIDEVYTVRAGKFRRYHGEGWKQFIDLPTQFLNARDIIYLTVGLWQSWHLMKRIRPDVVFSRGGFVSVPVALGAAVRRVPYITHDSDRQPSLANRLIARWAVLHAVAMPKELYPYPKDKTVTTGVPLSREFVPVDAGLKQDYRRQIGLSNDARLLFVIGGGLGSERVNRAVGEALPHLLDQYTNLQVVHVVGRAHKADMIEFYRQKLAKAEQGRVRIKGFIPDVYKYSGAADLIISRGGATNLAEFAVQGKACIIIPSGFLSGGHQLQNAAYLAKKAAAVVVDEQELLSDPNRLAKQVSELLASPEKRLKLADRLGELSRPHATAELAALILEHAKR